jgi:hypothetical protein
MAFKEKKKPSPNTWKECGLTREEFDTIVEYVVMNDWAWFADGVSPAKAIKKIRATKFHGRTLFTLPLLKEVIKKSCKYFGKRLKCKYSDKKEILFESHRWDAIRSAIGKYEHRIQGKGIIFAVRVLRLDVCCSERVLLCLTKRFHVWE